jgi:hypothetical protein
MRGTLVAVASLALAGLGVGACSSDATGPIQITPLGFDIVEALLLVDDSDATVGHVLLESTAGNCHAFQQGVAPSQILENDVLDFTLQAQDANTTATGGFLPLTAGTYNIVMQFTAGAGLFAAVQEYEANGGCGVSPTGANSGSIDVNPFNPDAGGTSTVSYSAVFGLNEFTGNFALTTCVVPGSPPYDAGTCIPPGSGI